MNLVHTLKTPLFKSDFVINAVSFMPPRFRFSCKNCVGISHLSHLRYVPLIFLPLQYDLSSNI